MFTVLACGKKLIMMRYEDDEMVLIDRVMGLYVKEKVGEAPDSRIKAQY